MRSLVCGNSRVRSVDDKEKEIATCVNCVGSDFVNIVLSPLVPCDSASLARDSHAYATPTRRFSLI